MAWSPGQILELTKSAGAALGIIKRAVNAGLSGNDIQKILSASGMGVQRTKLLETVAAVRYALKDPSVYLPSNPSLKPRGELIPLAIRPQNREYRYFVEHNVYDEDTDSYVIKGMIIDSSSLITEEEAITMAGETLLSYGGNLEDIESANVAGITRTDDPFYKFYQ